VHLSIDMASSGITVSHLKESQISQKRRAKILGRIRTIEISLHNLKAGKHLICYMNCKQHGGEARNRFCLPTFRFNS
jgi:hypothetical protein